MPQLAVFFKELDGALCAILAYAKAMDCTIGCLDFLLFITRIFAYFGGKKEREKM